MPRRPRIQFEDASYHVFDRGNWRERIFRTEEDYQTFEFYMLEAMRRSGVQLFNWNLIPNHFHFNVATPDGNLAEFMQRLLTRYSKYFNFTYRLVGHLFQGRYGSKLVDTDTYFKEIVRYVELNSCRIRSRPLAPLGKWRWASLHYLLQPETAWPEGCRRTFQYVLEVFSPDPGRARQLLLQFLADGLKSGTWEDFYRPKDGLFIGDDAFVERIKAAQGEPTRLARRTIESRLSLEQIVQAMQLVGGPTPAELAAPGKQRRSSRWRQVLVSVARRYFRIPGARLAAFLGRRESTISMMAARAESQVERWPETERLLQTLSAEVQTLSSTQTKCEM